MEKNHRSAINVREDKWMVIYSTGRAPLNTDRGTMMKKDHRSAINTREDKCMGIYSTGRAP